MLVTENTRRIKKAKLPENNKPTKKLGEEGSTPGNRWLSLSKSLGPVLHDSGFVDLFSGKSDQIRVCGPNIRQIHLALKNGYV